MHGMDNIKLIKVCYSAFRPLQAHVVGPTNVLVSVFTPNYYLCVYLFLYFNHILSKSNILVSSFVGVRNSAGRNVFIYRHVASSSFCSNLTIQDGCVVYYTTWGVFILYKATSRF
jgi:hypothetical protein